MTEKKVILITGSSRGIGRATARLAAKEGWSVVIHGQSDSNNLKNLHGELKDSFIIAGDVTDKAGVKREVGRVIEHYGRIDALVNCAGSIVYSQFLETSDEEILTMFKEHVLGTVHFCQEVIPIMQRQGEGRIVNISSIRGYPEMASYKSVGYSMAKESIRSVTASLAKIYAPQILVNAVAPGFTETDIAKQWSEDTRRKAVEGSLLKRTAQPEETAQVIMFLASDKNSFITGQTILVDGGYSLGGK
ncbi:MAG: SDR family oxidoreductase [Candidatus Chisholmbacteria bacterium]|nr:SDR family oxidoreductase [Candidatus Chisholmbacteria bacterium]